MDSKMISSCSSPAGVPNLSARTPSSQAPSPGTCSPTTAPATATPGHGCRSPAVFGLEKSQLLREALEKAGPAPRSREGREEAPKASQGPWILFCADLPSLIQEGPQCGLVALWMAGTLLVPPSGIPLERLVQMAVERGYTAQGEMFSVANMGRLAEEALGCQVELLRGGLGGPNRGRVLQHLVSGHPLLIPYPRTGREQGGVERRGPQGHITALALTPASATMKTSTMNHGSCWVFRACQAPAMLRTLSCQACFTSAQHAPPTTIPARGRLAGAVYLLSKQGKSWHYQLWDYDQVQDSNLQLTDFSPSRAADGRVYVVPAGGVRAGLCGQALLLRP
ncbi:hypothetical protein QTO34_010370 [Cnephaeus nilssonii]|uniref:Actin maturation protease n=1 Tax=Cnephaeus nilssonii TaxID=3371016 RepID=A0AA40HFC3_CNENI|nr:hypothetical protein QTO34_010370 [Eptesicus nilssonii]